MGIDNIIRVIFPKEDQFYDFLEQQARLGKEAAAAFATFGSGRSAREVRDAVQIIEHQADDIVRKLEDSLARTFVTPIDREDIHLLSNELDDVVDLTNLAARTCDLYRVKMPTPAMTSLMQDLVEAAGIIADAVPHLRTHKYSELIDLGRKIRLIEKRADETFRGAMSSLFEDNAIDAKELFKQKEVLDHIEHAVDYCDNVGDILANLAVKNG